MKNRYFNIKLYFEAVRQLKIIGIMGAVIMCIAAVLIPVGKSISTSDFDSVSKYSLFQLNPVLIGVFFILAPAMVISIFKFLDRRNASDFYHSLPVDRRCLYLSFMAGVITWIAGTILLASAVSVIVVLLLPNVSIITESIFIYMFTCFAAGVLVSCVFGLGVALSGTMFTNFTASVIILFTPRIIIFLVLLVLRQTLVFVDFNHMRGIFSNNLNIVSDFMLNLGNPTSILNIRSGAYTLVLGILYLLLGMYAFRKRKSETASWPAQNKVLQTLFRLVPALIISLIASSIVFLNVTSFEGYFGLSDSWFSVLVIYIIAVIAYFMYEIISTRKLNSVKKAVPGLLLLILLNIAYLAAMKGACEVIRNDKPSFRDINSISLVVSSNDAVTSQIEDAKIVDESIMKMLTSGLENSINMLDDRNVNPYEYQFNELAGYNIIDVAIEKKHETIYRKIALTDSDYDKLFEYLKSNDKLKKTYYKALDCAKRASDIEVYDKTMSHEDMMAIYRSFQKEAKSVDFSIIFNILNNNYSPEGYELPLNIQYNYKGQSYYMNIPVTEDFPVTYALYVNMINKANGISTNVISNLINKDYKSIFPDAPVIKDGYAALHLFTADNETKLSVYFSIEDGEFTINGNADVTELIRRLSREIKADTDIKAADLSRMIGLSIYIDGTDDEYNYYENSKEMWYGISENGRKIINDIVIYN